jgi:hypothetical protein
MQHEKVIRLEIDNLRWRIGRDRSSQEWVGHCDALRLTAEGATFGELLVDMNGVMQDLFRFLSEEGTLSAFLSQIGWRSRNVAIPVKAEGEELKFDVPFDIEQGPGFAIAMQPHA